MSNWVCDNWVYRFPNVSARSLSHRNRSDFCDLRLRCPSRTPEIAAITETRESHAALRFKGAIGKSLAICDFGLRFLSPKPLLSEGFLAIWAPSTRKSLAIAIVRFWCAKARSLLRIFLVGPGKERGKGQVGKCPKKSGLSQKGPKKKNRDGQSICNPVYWPLNFLEILLIFNSVWDFSGPQYWAPHEPCSVQKQVLQFVT